MNIEISVSTLGDSAESMMRIIKDLQEVLLENNKPAEGCHFKVSMSTLEIDKVQQGMNLSPLRQKPANVLRGKISGADLYERL